VVVVWWWCGGGVVVVWWRCGGGVVAWWCPYAHWGVVLRFTQRCVHSAHGNTTAGATTETTI
jgi:hypothetical protein